MALMAGSITIQLNMLQNITKKLAEVDKAMQKTMNSMAKANSKTARAIKQGFVAALKVAIAAVAAFGVAMYKITRIGAEFEQSIVTAGAVAGATAKELLKLEAAARLAGATTIFTATEAGEALVILSRAGFSVNESISALEPVLQFAAAAGGTLTQSANLITSALRQFGVEAGYATDIADTFTVAVTRSKLDIEGLTEAMKFAGPTGAALGFTLQETTVAVMQFANLGLQASMAGTNLRMAMSFLMKDTDRLRATLEKHNLTMEDVNPATQQYSELIIKLADTTITAADAINLFGVRAGPAMAAVINKQRELNKLSKEQQENVQGSIPWMLKQMEMRGGKAGEVMEDMVDSVAGQFKLLTSAITEVALSIFDLFGGDLKESITSLRTYILMNQEDIIIFFAGVLEAGKTFLSFFLSFGGDIISVFTAIVKVIWDVKQAFAISFKEQEIIYRSFFAAIAYITELLVNAIMSPLTYLADLANKPEIKKHLPDAVIGIADAITGVQIAFAGVSDSAKEGVKTAVRELEVLIKESIAGHNEIEKLGNGFASFFHAAATGVDNFTIDVNKALTKMDFKRILDEVKKAWTDLPKDVQGATEAMIKSQDVAHGKVLELNKKLFDLTATEREKAEAAIANELAAYDSVEEALLRQIVTLQEKVNKGKLTAEQVKIEEDLIAAAKKELEEMVVKRDKLGILLRKQAAEAIAAAEKEKAEAEAKLKIKEEEEKKEKELERIKEISAQYEERQKILLEQQNKELDRQIKQRKKILDLAFATMDTGLVGGVGTIVGSTDVAGVAGGFGDMFNNLGDIIQSTGGGLATEIIGAFFKVFGNIVAITGQAIKFLEKLPAFISDVAPKLIKEIPRIVKAGLKLLPTLFRDVIPDLFKAIVEVIPVLIDALPEVINMLVEMIADLLYIILDNLDEILGSLIKAVIKTLLNLPAMIGKIVAAVIKGVTDFATDVVKDAWNGVKDFASDIAGGISNALGLGGGGGGPSRSDILRSDVSFAMEALSDEYKYQLIILDDLSTELGLTNEQLEAMASINAVLDRLDMSGLMSDRLGAINDEILRWSEGLADGTAKTISEWERLAEIQEGGPSEELQILIDEMMVYKTMLEESIPVLEELVSYMGEVLDAWKKLNASMDDLIEDIAGDALNPEEAIDYTYQRTQEALEQSVGELSDAIADKSIESFEAVLDSAEEATNLVQQIYQQETAAIREALAERLGIINDFETAALKINQQLLDNYIARLEEYGDKLQERVEGWTDLMMEGLDNLIELSKELVENEKVAAGISEGIAGAQRDIEIEKQTDLLGKIQDRLGTVTTGIIDVDKVRSDLQAQLERTTDPKLIVELAKQIEEINSASLNKDLQDIVNKIAEESDPKKLAELIAEAQAIPLRGGGTGLDAITNLDNLSDVVNRILELQGVSSKGKLAMDEFKTTQESIMSSLDDYIKTGSTDDLPTSKEFDEAFKLLSEAYKEGAIEPEEFIRYSENLQTLMDENNQNIQDAIKAQKEGIMEAFAASGLGVKGGSIDALKNASEKTVEQLADDFKNQVEAGKFEDAKETLAQLRAEKLNEVITLTNEAVQKAIEDNEDQVEKVKDLLQQMRDDATTGAEAQFRDAQRRATFMIQLIQASMNTKLGNLEDINEDMEELLEQSRDSLASIDETLLRVYPEGPPPEAPIGTPYLTTNRLMRLHRGERVITRDQESRMLDNARLTTPRSDTTDMLLDAILTEMKLSRQSGDTQVSFTVDIDSEKLVANGLWKNSKAKNVTIENGEVRVKDFR